MDYYSPRTPSPDDIISFNPYKDHFQDYNNSRGSLLQELYDQPEYDHEWQQQQQQQQQQLPPPPPPARRNTFPYVRQDCYYDFHYGEPLTADPNVLHYPDPPIKLEDQQHHQPPIIVPSQSPFYRHSPDAPINISYLSPHTGLPVQHTDDAASKETQYLRRRCFNCHTTEPPSWRRSTLNPGKIVCNKCGLYERTHLRPRPLRFDELRSGNKARKQPKPAVAGSPKPKLSAPPQQQSHLLHHQQQQQQQTAVKKEPHEFGIARRSSVSSSSGSGTSDWDDNVSVYSSGSAPTSSYNSPSIPTFPIPHDQNSQSPPAMEGGIRLPNTPLSDIATLQSSPQLSGSPQMSQHAHSPRRSATAPGAYFTPYDGWQGMGMVAGVGISAEIDNKDNVVRVEPAPVAA